MRDRPADTSRLVYCIHCCPFDCEKSKREGKFHAYTFLGHGVIEILYGPFGLIDSDITLTGSWTDRSKREAAMILLVFVYLHQSDCHWAKKRIPSRCHVTIPNRRFCSQITAACPMQGSNTSPGPRVVDQPEAPP